jgi:hypothetical protein
MIRHSVVAYLPAIALAGHLQSGTTTIGVERRTENSATIKARPATQATPIRSESLGIQEVATRRLDEAEGKRDHNEALVAEGTIALAIITGVLAAGTIVLAIFTYRLWADSKAAAAVQAGQMQSSLQIAERSAAAATTSAKATEASVEALYETAEIQLRAYVFPELEGRVTICAPSDAPQFQLKIRNSGNTPATKVLVRVQRFGSTFPLVGTLPDLPEPPVLSSQLIGPNSHILWPTVPEKLSAAEIVAHQQGGFAHYYKGDVRYFDAFGKARTTQFLLWLYGDTLAGYRDGNSST